MTDQWFSEVRTLHPTVAGRFDRSFALTRQGFTLLAMGWTGEWAMALWQPQAHKPMTASKAIRNP